MKYTVDLALKDSVMTPSGASARPAVVQAALETIQVAQFGDGANPADPTVTLTFSGDGALGTAAHQASQPEDAIHPDQDQADITLLNLDAPLAPPSPRQPPALLRPASPLSAPVTTADAPSLQTMKTEGVDVVNLASAALAAADPSALRQTMHLLEQADMYPVGAGRNPQEARRPEIIDVKGQRLAYLGYSSSDLQAAEPWRAGINPGIKTQIAEDIQAIRDQVDWVIVNYRWNQDLTQDPADWQKDLAHFAVDQGADLVVGHHPNALQGAEIYKGRAIAYSIGNFMLADRPTSPDTPEDYDTAVLKVSVRSQQMRLEFLPVQVRQSTPKLVRGEKAAEILQHIRQASTLFEQPLESPTTLEVRSPSTPIETPVFLPDATETPLSTEPSPIPDTSSSIPSADPEASLADGEDGEPITNFEPETVEPETVEPETAYEPSSELDSDALQPSEMQAAPESDDLELQEQEPISESSEPDFQTQEPEL